jgi:Protein of unknown function (DUF1553)/Protein of unknown function (DUF1549)/Planctomycete cytochrome C
MTRTYVILISPGTEARKSNMQTFRFSSLVPALFLLAGGALAENPVDFSRDVRPILSNRCFKCHGPDLAGLKGELRLDIAKSAYGPGESGKIAIVPGKPEASEIIHRITSKDPELIMPPPEAKMEITSQEIEILQKWVSQGAEYRPHWAFVPPRRPELDAAAENPIDTLVRKKLVEAKMKPSPEADRYSLIRRVSLDLTGLPPSPEEVEVFAKDPDPLAYEKLVDRLLASPHYGERWARRWLDLARYADTNGYEKDRERVIWPWRDWVIRALNKDMPFDQFTIKQLAGDLLPNATLDDKIATGFHRNSMLNEEGGIDPLEFRFHAMTDRVATTGTTWLGLTVGCAQCHTHKYDPIQHREYYGLMAFLNNANEVPLDLPDPELPKRQADREKKASALLDQLASKWPVPKALDAEWKTPKLVTAVNEAGVSAKLGTDQSAAFPSQGGERESFTLVLDSQAASTDRVRLEALADPGNRASGPGRTEQGNFVLTEIEVLTRPLGSAGAWEPVSLAKATAEVEQSGYPVAHAIDGNPATGWAVQDSDGKKISGDRTAVFHFTNSLTGPRQFMVKLAQNFGGFHTLKRVRMATGTPFKESPPPAKPETLATQAFEKWLANIKKHTVPWTILKPDAMVSNEPILSLEPDHSIFVSGDTTKDDRFTLTFKNVPAGLAALRLEALTDSRLPANGPGMTYYEGKTGDFLLYDFNVKVDGKEIQLASATASTGNAAAMLDASDLSGWTGTNTVGEPIQAVFQFAEPLPTTGELVVELKMGRHYAATLGKFRLSTTTVPKTAVARQLPEGIEELLVTNSEAGLSQARDRLFDHFLSQAPELEEPAKAIRELLHPLLPPRTPAFVERTSENRRKTFLHNRGEYLQPKEQIEPFVPAFLSPMAAGEPKNRLGLAHWLVARDNPLTARVTVNRHWQAFFGTGLTKSLDDFGFQGELPMNQALLDWLAVEFMENGWSVKKLHRAIVTSATYKQDSKVTPEHLERDPENRLLARGPRVRAEAEMIRDLALKVAGLLSGKQFGPPVRPPQPASVTEGTYAGMTWKVSTGEDRYRRALYTFAKRSTPYAASQTFDAPTGEACVARREVSNTPLQSLVLLNDEVFFEAAQAFGKNIAAHPGPPEEKLRFAFMQCLTRPPSPAETQRLLSFYQAQSQRLQSGGLKLAELMPKGATSDQASWMTVARVLLNLDETITKN